MRNFYSVKLELLTLSETKEKYFIANYKNFISFDNFVCCLSFRRY